MCDDVDDCVGEYDECGVCNGDGADVECSDGSYVCDASECPDDGTCTSQVCLDLDGGSMSYSSVADIAGFQFSHNGCVTGASGGDAAANGFTVSVSGSTVLAFSFTGAVIPAGDGLLVNLDGNVTQGCLSDFVFSGSGGTSLTVGFGDGGEPPCDDVDGDGVCDDVDDCVGEYDECGVCNGDGLSCIVELSFGNLQDSSVDIIMSSNVDVAGFQFDITGVNITGSSGGSANDYGFTVSTSSSTVLGFSCAGSTIQADQRYYNFELRTNSIPAGSDNIVISGPGGLSYESIGGDCIAISEPSLVDIYYDSVQDIAGFQFDTEGVTLFGAEGGAAAANGFTVSTSSSTVLGFSFTGSVIPAGSGVLVSLEVDDPSSLCLNNLVLSGLGGAGLDAIIENCNTIVYLGCDDVDGDGVCDDVDDCVGEYDECGVCNGDGADVECSEVRMV